MYEYLNPDKALIFRIEHVDNLLWDLQEGALHCRNSGEVNPEYVNIGDSSLIGARATKPVSTHPGGNLSDYVPFYFTPFSMMMYNIVTGHRVQQRPRSDIIFFVSSIFKLLDLGIPFVFTNQHAYAVEAEFYSDPDELDQIDWNILQKRDFSRDDADPGKKVRYQAEALVYQKVPLSALLGIACFDEATKARIEVMLAGLAPELGVHCLPKMYF